MPLPSVNIAKCLRCARCIEVCPAGCLELEGSIRLVRPDKCLSCGRCVRACPVKAISFH
ncbi:MAG TPA: 4Fe-4S binding protein [Synergistales bacterium]|nr:4Fe-4S binding protein [Synergistales bacterium]